MVKRVRWGLVSDVHLFHKNTPTTHTLAGLDKYITNSDFLSTIDILAIVGDLFDDQESFESEDAQAVLVWISKMLWLCSRHGVLLLVLEGTISHDWGQSVNIMTIHDILKQNPEYRGNVKYVKSVSIERIEPFGIDVLYIPDEVHHDNADTWSDVVELMQSKQLTAVDVALMHGMFKYQAPPMTKPHATHDEANYLSIVRYFISIGHIHQYSSYEHIYAQGSFDRGCHGDEKPKGFLRICMGGDEPLDVEFIENKTAKKYVTYTWLGADLEDGFQYIFKKIMKLPDYSHVRVKTTRSNPMYQALGVLKDRWPFIHWKIEASDEKETASDVAIVEEDEYTALVINSTSISKLVGDRLLKQQHSPGMIDVVLNKLNEVI